MPKPAPGTYYIVNRINSPIGEKLAITVGSGNSVIVTPLTNAGSQKWTIADYDTSRQSFSPVSNPSLQISLAGNVLGLSTSTTTAWYNFASPNGLSVRYTNDTDTVHWGLSSATANSSVVYSTGLDEKYFWVLLSV